MKTRITVWSLLALLSLAVTALPAIADNLYDNGTPFGYNGYAIDTNNITTNTVDCAAVCTPTSLEFWTVAKLGTNIGTSVNWSFTSGPFIGVGYNSGQSAIPNALPCVDNGVNQVCQISVTLQNTLAQPAHSWLNLTGLAPGVDWVISRNPDPRTEGETCQLVSGVCGPTLMNISTEAFNVGGTVVPEPSSIFMLGSGLVGLAGWLRRRVL